jgi:pyruvate kinase
MKRTKIICTLGPSTDTLETLVRLINAGMDVVRLNFSHGNKQERDARIALIREARKVTGKDIPILLDTKGIKIRTGYVEGYSEENKKAVLHLQKGSVITFVCDTAATKSGGPACTASKMYIDYEELPAQIKTGQHILLDDGLIDTEVTSILGKEIVAKVLNEGTLVSRRSVNLPGVRLTMEALTEQDRQDILYGIANDVDFIALSFVKRMDDVVKARKFLEENGASHIMIIAKIENQEGVENLDEILAVSNGVMVARGDMAVEVPFEKVPAIQKRMIGKALRSKKIVVTATQMLHSMIKEPTPTRAEVSDIFNAVQDSTTCIMLSGETANGDYPEEAVRVMTTVAQSSEMTYDYQEKFFALPFDSSGHVTTSICHAAVSTAYQVKAKAIVAYSESGLTARRLSSLRPGIPLIVISNNAKVLRQCHMFWGVMPVYHGPLATPEELFSTALRVAQESGMIEEGDNIVAVAGTSVGLSGSTNTLRVMTKGSVVLRGSSLMRLTSAGAVKICKDASEADQKLQQGDILVVYRLNPDMEPYLHKIGGILLAGTEYDEGTMMKAKSYKIPIIIDVQGVTARIADGMQVRVLGEKGVVLKTG